MKNGKSKYILSSSEKLHIMANIQIVPGNFKAIQFKTSPFVTSIIFYNDDSYVVRHFQA